MVHHTRYQPPPRHSNIERAKSWGFVEFVLSVEELRPARIERARAVSCIWSLEGVWMEAWLQARNAGQRCEESQE